MAAMKWRLCAGLCALTLVYSIGCGPGDDKTDVDDNEVTGGDAGSGGSTGTDGDGGAAPRDASSDGEGASDGSLGGDSSASSGGDAGASDAAAEPDADTALDGDASAESVDADTAPTDAALPLPPTATLADGVTGLACTSVSDCDGEDTRCARAVGGITTFNIPLNESPAPGGYCTGDCLSNDDCGKGAACIGAVPELFGVGECQKVCRGDADCREGYACLDLLGLGGLIGIPRTCLPKPATESLEDGVAGSPCSSNEDCGGANCTGPLRDQARDYFACTGACYSNEACGADAVCRDFLVTQLLSFPGTCEQACQSDEECQHPNRTCQGTGAARSCRPPARRPTPADAGVSVDAETPVDAEMPVDAEAPVDAEMPVDAGPDDSGDGDAG